MAFSLVQRLHEIPLAVVDTETTGASADFGHRVIEVGLVRIEHGQVVAEYQQLIDPQRQISLAITALTGIGQTMVAGCPTFLQQSKQLTDLLTGAAIVGHNVRFDLSFLLKEYRRSGLDLPQLLGPGTPVLDTVSIARRRFGRGGNGLQNLARRLDIQPVTAHRALADAQTTHRVLDRLLQPVGGWNLQLCDAYIEQGGAMALLPTNPRESPLPLELEEALEQKRPVLMEYVDARGARTFRTIEPLHIRKFQGELTLVAHCQLRGEQRTFKLDRIVHLSRIEIADAEREP